MLKRIKVAENASHMDIKDVLNQIDKVLEEVPEFNSRKVYPYNFPITVEELLRPARDFNNYTRSSQHQIRAEVFGFISIINSWIDYHNEDDVEVEVLSGKKAGEIILTKVSTAILLEEGGLAKRLEVL